MVITTKDVLLPITAAALIVAGLYLIAVHDWDGSPKNEPLPVPVEQPQQQPPAPVKSCQDQLTDCRYKLEKAGGNMRQEAFEAITCETQVRKCYRLRAVCYKKGDSKNFGAPPCGDKKEAESTGVTIQGVTGLNCDQDLENENPDCVPSECCATVYNGSTVCVPIKHCKNLEDGTCKFPITDNCDLSKAWRGW